MKKQNGNQYIINKTAKQPEQNFYESFMKMRTFLLLWVTQTFSGLGSAMTSYALVIWSYSQQGSALMTALLMVCTYTPYVLFSIFAGALSDRWDKKKTMLACDMIAAVMTVITFILLHQGLLRIWHLYLINVVNGLMNTVQQPASEVAVTRLLPKEYYQKVGGLRYISSASNSILTPILATAVLGIAGIDAVIGVSMLLGGILASFLKEPKSRVRVICNCLLFSMSFENFMLALGRSPMIWCIGGFLGWIMIPLMNANLDAVMRLRIPEQMQGRIYAVRNSFQFLTIPLGYFAGGWLVDVVFEPIMARQDESSFLVKLFGVGKGSGAAFLFFVIAFAGIAVCLYFRRDKYIWELEK